LLALYSNIYFLAFSKHDEMVLPFHHGDTLFLFSALSQCQILFLSCNLYIRFSVYLPCAYLKLILDRLSPPALDNMSALLLALHLSLLSLQYRANAHLVPAVRCWLLPPFW